jgi:phosphoribosylanthranilate isomerase
VVRVKICGITNLKDALASVDAGCDALGFAFFKKSPRYIRPEKAGRIARALPRSLIKIGVFVNAREKSIKRIAKLCCLDMLQFHGNESPEFCRRFKGYKIIKVFRVKDRIDREDLLKYRPFAYLFDTFVKSKPGGTGEKFNWKLIRHLKGIRQPIFLSGGLSAGNVRKAIKVAHPDWVDVCSSIELVPGRKDHLKVKKFIKAAKGR